MPTTIRNKGIPVQWSLPQTTLIVRDAGTLITSLSQLDLYFMHLKLTFCVEARDSLTFLYHLQVFKTQN